MISGRVWKVGDHINTDLIIAGRYLDNYDMKKIAAHAMEDVDIHFSANVRKGDIMVAGRNFGCGSSREQAPLVLKECGISAVVAQSFSRIFYRNALNVGLSLVVCAECTESFNAGDVLNLDLKKGTIGTVGTDREIKFSPLPESLLEIVECGGLVPYMKSRLDPRLFQSGQEKSAPKGL